MNKLLAWPGLILLFVIIAGIVLAIQVGRLNSGSMSPVRRSSNCPLPCWRGIQPGAVFIAQANRVLVGQGYLAQNTATDRTHIRYLAVDATCDVRLQHEEAVVNEVRLSNCPALKLGDVLVELGRPDAITPNTLFFNFEAGRLRVQLKMQDCGAHLSPYIPVDYLSLTPDTTLLSDGVVWRGFAFPWRYERLKPPTVPLAC